MAGHQWGPHMLRIRGQRKQLPGNVLEGEDWAVKCEFKIRTTNSEGPVLSQSSR